jgi:hypothetical protein
VLRALPCPLPLQLLAQPGWVFEMGCVEEDRACQWWTAVISQLPPPSGSVQARLGGAGAAAQECNQACVGDESMPDVGRAGSRRRKGNHGGNGSGSSRIGIGPREKRLFLVGAVRSAPLFIQLSTYYDPFLFMTNSY